MTGEAVEGRLILDCCLENKPFYEIYSVRLSFGGFYFTGKSICPLLQLACSYSCSRLYFIYAGIGTLV